MTDNLDSSFATQATPDSLAIRRKMAMLLMKQGADTSPVQAWSQGAARIAQSMLGNYDLAMAGKDEENMDAKKSGFMASLLGGGSPSAAAPAPVSAPAPMAAPAPAPSPSPEVSPVVGALSQPRGYRNNNPLNIEAGSFTQGQPGFAGSDGRFAKFDSMDGGTAAANRLLDIYQNKHGLNTPAGIVARWAPSSDGNNVNAYAGQIAKALGIGPNDPIPPEMRPQLIAAMARHENGKPMPNQQVASLDPSIGVAQAPRPAAQPLQQVAQATPQPQGITQRIIDGLNSKDPNIRRAAMGMAPGMIQQMLKPETTDEIKEYNLYTKQELAAGRQPQSFSEYKMMITKARANNVSVNNTVNPILKGVGDRFNDTFEVGKAAIPQIQGIHEARKALDQGAFTGAGADPKLFLAKVGNVFGLKSEEAANTEVARSAIGNSVLAKAKTLGANPSNADRDYIEKVVGGSITLEEKSIRRLLDMQEKWARDAIKRANDDGKKILSAQPEELRGISGLLQIQEPDTYDNFLKANPIAVGGDGWQNAPGVPGVRIREKK